MEIVGGFESTYMPAHDRDVFETSQHDVRRRDDLALLASCGVRRVRYPIRWHEVEQHPGSFRWSDTDAAFDDLAAAGLQPIVDLVHHTSYPRWLTDGFFDRRFPSALQRYVEAVADRYPGIAEYTVFNEPFSTLFLCGHEGLWPPQRRGMTSFTTLLDHAVPAIAAATRAASAAWPEARHLYVDSCEHHTGHGPSGRRYARYANDRRFVILDALLGRLDPAHRRVRPFVADLLDHGGRTIFEIEPVRIDVVGLDYYAHCQWHFGPAGGTAPGPTPRPLSELIVEYARRWRLPVWLSETNIRGYPSDRATWLRYVVEQIEVAGRSGVDVEALCWFPFVDSCDWDSLLARCEGNVDPVGAVSVDDDGSRITTSMTEALATVAGGGTSSDLAAYRFHHPVASWLAGYLPQVAHWPWVEPPDIEWNGCPGDDVYSPLGQVVEDAG